MSQTDFIAVELEQLAHRLQRVERHLPATAAELASDEDALDLVCVNLMLAVQLCMDIAARIIAEKRLPPSRSGYESFGKLGRMHEIDMALAERLIGAVSFRNVVARACGKLEVELAFRIATEGPEDMRAFARAAHAFLRSRTA